MRAIFGVSASEIMTPLRRWRLVFTVFEVRMWRILDWPRLNLPEAVLVKRLAAPEWVFNFGMVLPDTAFLTTNQVYTTLRTIVTEFPPQNGPVPSYALP